MSELTILDNMIGLFERPGTWCQGALAIDSIGRPVPSTSPQASRWCLLGALVSFSQDSNPGEFENCALAIKHSIGEIYPELLPFNVFLVDFNDDVAKDVEDVLKVLRNTRKYLNKEEK
mgnify:CR=1 FL=1